MRTNTKTCLDLNAKWEQFLQRELEEFKSAHPEDKFEIVCWVDELTESTARILYDYLASNNCPTLLKTGGEIIGKGRSTFHRYTQKISS